MVDSAGLEDLEEPSPAAASSIAAAGKEGIEKGATMRLSFSDAEGRDEIVRRPCMEEEKRRSEFVELEIDVYEDEPWGWTRDIDVEDEDEIEKRLLLF